MESNTIDYYTKDETKLFCLTDEEEKLFEKLIGGKHEFGHIKYRSDYNFKSVIACCDIFNGFIKNCTVLINPKCLRFDAQGDPHYEIVFVDNSDRIKNIVKRHYYNEKIFQFTIKERINFVYKIATINAELLSIPPILSNVEEIHDSRGSLEMTYNTQTSNYTVNANFKRGKYFIKFVVENVNKYFKDIIKCVDVDETDITLIKHGNASIDEYTNLVKFYKEKLMEMVSDFANC